MCQTNLHANELIDIIYLEDVNPVIKKTSGVRGDLYKILLISGNENKNENELLHEAKSTLLFFTPEHFCANEELIGIRNGFLCTFSTSFFNDTINNMLCALPMFSSGNVYNINKAQAQHICEIFTRILTELASDYLYKYDLIRNYIFEITHYVLKYLN